MKKILKIALTSLALFSIIIISTKVVFANNTLGNGLNGSVLTNVTKNDTNFSKKFETPICNVYETIYTIMRVLCVAGIVIQGVRYMYAAGDAKAKIKQSLIYIIIGTIFVFGAGLIADKIANSFGDISK